MQRLRPKCAHERIRAPIALGEKGAYCATCDAQVPCEHPERGPSVLSPTGIACTWCGAVIRERQDPTGVRRRGGR